MSYTQQHICDETFRILPGAKLRSLRSSFPGRFGWRRNRSPPIPGKIVTMMSKPFPWSYLQYEPFVLLTYISGLDSSKIFQGVKPALCRNVALSDFWVCVPWTLHCVLLLSCINGLLQQCPWLKGKILPDREHSLWRPKVRWRGQGWGDKSATEPISCQYGITCDSTEM